MEFVQIWQFCIILFFLIGILFGLPVVINRNYHARECQMPWILNVPLVIGSGLRFVYFLWSGQILLAIPDCIGLVLGLIIEMQRAGHLLIPISQYHNTTA